jgi:FxsC-like protein
VALSPWGDHIGAVHPSEGKIHMAHWFFLSYARCDADVYFKRFRQELAEAVRVKVGGDLESVAFFDRDDIGAGEEWPDTLSSALQHSRIFVPIYTRSYFASDYCGREWEVFRQRQDALMANGAAQRPPVIQPVLWVGKEDLPDPMPGVARGAQFDNAAYGDDYAEIGLRQMMLQNRYRDARRTFIAALADRIVDVARDHELPPLGAKPLITDIRSAFVEAPAAAAPGAVAAPPVPAASTTRGPRYAQFIFVAGTRPELEALRQRVDCYGLAGEDWKPYHPTAAMAVADVALEVAGGERLWPEPVPLGDDLIERLEQAKAQDKVVAIIADSWTLRLPAYNRFMRDYDERNFLNCVVLVPWNPADDETATSRPVLEDAVRFAFPNRSAVKDPKSFIDTIVSPEDLRANLSNALATARARVITAAEVQRRAESQNVVVKPIISARPGG